MNSSQRIYLDHAATSWPRLPGVIETMSEFEQNFGAAAGRGSYASSTQASSRIQQLRMSLARFVNAKAEEVAFVSNGTAANNVALAGTLNRDDHVITTQADHNSVLRPLQLLHQQRGVQWTALPVDRSGRVDPSDIAKAVRPNTRMICVTSASNVTGAVNDLESIGVIAKQHELTLMVDAAQSLGYLPIDMDDLGIDILCAPGHKGAGGPLGTGLIVANKKLHSSWKHLWIGGTGELSQQVDGDFAWNSVIESGNFNTPALVGWSVGLQQVQSEQLASRTHAASQHELYAKLLAILSNVPFGVLIGHDDDRYIAVFSIDCGRSPLAASDWAALLDSSYRIEVRSGLHCAALIHKSLGTEEGGTLRFSLGHTSTQSDLDRLEDAIVQMKKFHF